MSCDSDSCECEYCPPEYTRVDVVNNKGNPATTSRMCKEAARKYTSMCKGCSLLMRGKGFVVDDLEYCFLCASHVIGYLKDSLEGRCQGYQLFKDHYFSDSSEEDNPPEPLCTECQTVHPTFCVADIELPFMEDPFTGDKYDLLCLAEVLLINADLLEFMRGFREYISTRNYTTVLNNKKRSIIRTHFPNATDSECEQITTRKYNSTDTDETTSIVDFVKWLRVI